MVNEDMNHVEKPVEKKTLLEKYDIPIEHLSYEYITQCENAKELERIIIILRSGEEGYYPDLTTHAENRLADIKPLSTVLRVAEPVLKKEMLEPENRVMLENDITEWMSEMKMREKDLEEGRAMRTNEPIPQPAIRKITFDQPEKNKQSSQNQKKHKRIAACDYTGWDKYDAETELNRIDLQHDMKQAQAKRAQKILHHKEEKMKNESRNEIVNKLTLTGTELSMMAEKDREKGNEAFKAGDYEEALHFYNSSIAIDATINAYNNRAITYIKLERYDDAVNDCNKVISMDYKNIKALLRRGLALDHLEKKAQALADYEAVLKLEPTNKVAIAAVNKLRGPCSSKKIRMKIEDEAPTLGNSTNEMRGSQNKVENTLNTNSKHVRENGTKITDETKAAKSKSVPKESMELRPNLGNFTDDRTRGKQFSNEKAQMRTQVCFCNNAPSSSQCSTPQPHFRDMYCPKSSPNSGKFPKAQSIFTDTKISYGKASSVIIEEIPNEPCERSENKENQRDGKINTDKNKAKSTKRRSSDFTNFGGGDHNLFAKKSAIVEKECPPGNYDLKADKKFGQKVRKNSLEVVNKSTILSSPQSRSENTSGIIIEEISSEKLVKVHDESKIKNGPNILEKIDTIPKSFRTFENGSQSNKIDTLKNEVSSNTYEKHPVEGTNNSSKYLQSTTMEPNSISTDSKPSSKKSPSSNIDDIQHTTHEKSQGKSSCNEDIAEQKIPRKVEKTVTCATDDKGTTDEESELVGTTISKENNSETIGGMEKIEFEKIESPYEFLRQWYSIRNDRQLIRHANLLKAMPPENVEAVMGNKLDGDMLSLILTCLEQHFCCPENAKLLNRFLQHLGQVKRFSIIKMFMDKKDKKALQNIFSFLDSQEMEDLTRDLRKMYDVPM